MGDVLMLVTNEDASFYRQQVDALEELGLNCDTVAVPNSDDGTRRLRHYARFYGATLRKSLSEYDVVHANYGLTAPAALAQRRRPVVLSLWGSDLLGAYGRLSTWCANRCDEVIVMSDAMATELDRDAHVIPHGVDMERFSPTAQASARDELGWDQNARIVLFPYDPERPIKDFPRARAVVDDAASRLDAHVALRTVSGVDHGEIPRYMNATDVMLLTSRREGSPNTVKEALACNCPVVSTDVGDVSNYVEALDYSGVCADDDELVERLVATLRAAPVSEGREQVTALGLSEMARNIASVYRRAGAQGVTVDG
ncbi:glycosyltransferase [Halomicrobium mukohataei]|uniref:Glycosyltransferase n=1 Tax=Halomicrobium mukohataei TaxID=57705 RepID=A0A847U3S4_9EURY|nr:glycosyltransferase [Halomicrobium mukohataei]NLV10323.1 glycosyltransferase [Halomicrobium mukohataei]